MILSVQFTTVLDKDTTISHRTEVVVDSEQEAHERGAEFNRLMVSFNHGIISTEGEPS